MKKIFFLFFIAIINCNLKIKPINMIKIFSETKNPRSTDKLDKWIKPNPELKYNQTCFLGAHNCNSAYNYGYKPYAQQKWNIKEQLENGIRCLLPDIWPTEIKTNEECKRKDGETTQDYLKRATIRMCHGPCKINTYLRPTELVKNLIKLKKLEKITTPLFSDALNTIKNFLQKKENTTEIVTLFLENYADNELVDEIIKESEIKDLVFKPGDWDFEKNKYNWPKLKWMQENNKRIVFFNDHARSQTKYTFPTWQFVIENLYGTLDLKKSQEERNQSLDQWQNNFGSKQRSLLMINYFSEFPIPIHKDELKKFLQKFSDKANYIKLNSTEIEKLINTIYNEGLKKPGSQGKGNNSNVQIYNSVITKNKFPNFIVLDFVNKGNAMAIVNYINEIMEWEQLEKLRTEKPQTIYKQESVVTKVINKIKSIFLPGH